MGLTEEDVNILVSDDSDKELALQLSWQPVNVESLAFSFIGGPETSAASNPSLQPWIGNPDLTGGFSLVSKPVRKGRKRPLRTRTK